MSNWTWKQAVADEVVKIVNDRKSSQFTLDEVYAREPVFAQRFPRNKHLREKLRQTLQRLRDTGLVRFLGEARYEIDFTFADIQSEPITKDEVGIQIPGTAKVVRQIRLRNTLLTSHMKQRYDYCCQVCQHTIQLVNGKYAEAHHIRPLGSPHFGGDAEGNILVLCPNHHVMLDRGAISIDPQTFLVEHVHCAFEPRRLFIQPWHKLHVPSVVYYAQHVFAN